MLIRFAVGSISKPILEITNNKSEQLIIRFLPYKDEHVTIHKGYFKQHERSGLLRTIHSLEKPIGNSDILREHIARDIYNYANPERHSKYIDHSFLEKLINSDGFFIIGKYIDLENYQPKPKYMKDYKLEIKVPKNKFMLYLYLCTDDNPCKDIVHRFSTTLGEICFKISRN